MGLLLFAVIGFATPGSTLVADETISSSSGNSPEEKSIAKPICQICVKYTKPPSELLRRICQTCPRRAPPTRGTCGIVWFYHVPKCGGTAIGLWLESLHRGGYIEEVVNLFGRDPIDFDSFFSSRITPVLTNASGRLIAVHHHHHGPGLGNGTSPPWALIRRSLQAQGCRLTRFTILRDPVERLVSLLQFSNFAHNSSKSEWRSVLAESRGGEVDNGMIRYLLYNQRSTYPIDHPWDRPITNATLQEVIGILNEFEHIGKLATVDSDLQKVAELAGLPWPGPGSHRAPRVNRSPRVLADWEIKDLMPLLEARVAMDRRLYSYFDQARAPELGTQDRK